MTGCTNIDGLAGRIHVFSHNLNFQYMIHEFFSLSIAEFTVPQNMKGTIILVPIINYIKLWF